jgi:hypothetical protein
VSTFRADVADLLRKRQEGRVDGAVLVQRDLVGLVVVEAVAEFCVSCLVGLVMVIVAMAGISDFALQHVEPDRHGPDLGVGLTYLGGHVPKIPGKRVQRSQ